MDRRDLAVCAGLLATIGAIIGCGGHAQPSQDRSPAVATTALVSAQTSEAATPNDLVEASAKSTTDSTTAVAIPQATPATESAASESAASAGESPKIAEAESATADKPREARSTSQVASENLPAAVSPAAFPSSPAPSEDRNVGRERVAARASSNSAARDAELHFAITAGESTAAAEVVEPSSTITSESSRSETADREVPVDSHTASHESLVDNESEADSAKRPTFRLQVAGPEIPDSVTLRVADPSETAAQAKAAREKAVAQRDAATRTASPGSAKRSTKHVAAKPLEAAKPPLTNVAGPKRGDDKPKGPTLAVRPKPSQAQAAKQDAPKSEDVEVAPVGPTLAKRPAEPVVVGDSAPRSDVSFAPPAEPSPSAVAAQPIAEPQMGEPKASKPTITAVPSATTADDKVASQNTDAGSSHIAPREQANVTAAPQPQTEADQVASKPTQSVGQTTTPEVAKQDATAKPSASAAAVEPAKSAAAPSQIAASEARKQDSAPVVVAPPPRSARRAIVGPSVREREINERDTMGGRTPQMMAEVTKADAQVAHGFQLAERGALYLARSEFISALKLIAQANDVETGTRQFSRAVTAGLIALKESGDFVRHTSKVEDIDLTRIVAAHTTSVLKDKDVSEMAPTVAAQAYYDFARVQLAAAASQEVVASMALYGLARATLVGAGGNAQQAEFAGQATALYQTAIAVEPRNFRAANDLGVLLAKQGRLGEAAEMLTQSASLAPSAAAWQNLATVYSRMGDKKLAEQMQAQSRALQHSGPGAVGPTVQWVDPATFASVAPATDGPLPPPVPQKTERTPAKQPAAAPANPPASVAKRISEWLPMNIRR